MASYSNATEREHTPRTINSVTNKTFNIPINDAVKRRAWAVILDESIDEGSRNIIRYALGINDPLLAELVLRVGAGESIVEALVPEVTSNIAEADSSKRDLETLVQMICGGGDDPGTRSAALLVLMATLQNAENPKSLAPAAKHLAFAQCGEFNAFGMIDAQIAMLWRELLMHTSHFS